MTIRQIANELKVSPQAVYQKLRNNGIDVKTLTAGKNKNLTSEGEYTIRQLFSDDTPQPVKQDRQTETDKELVELRRQVADLLEENKTLKERVEELKKDKEYYQNAQDLLQRLLPGPSEKKSLWQRIRGK